MSIFENELIYLLKEGEIAEFKLDVVVNLLPDKSGMDEYTHVANTIKYNIRTDNGSFNITFYATQHAWPTGEDKKRLVKKLHKELLLPSQNCEESPAEDCDSDGEACTL
ncbi:MAG: hypothetical protein KAS93_05285 [Gammaproteobacteria bacterium]|nr:hypothetical protein [Gammaproteobacteria bacterium]